MVVIFFQRIVNDPECKGEKEKTKQGAETVKESSFHNVGINDQRNLKEITLLPPSKLKR
jgi:hypothetical protein